MKQPCIKQFCSLSQILKLLSSRCSINKLNQDNKDTNIKKLVNYKISLQKKHYF